ncbi:MAG: FadR family transcriptional regulator, partial [Mesorhizobium sp.]
AEAAREAMRAHLTSSQQRYRERLQARQAYYAKSVAAASTG